MFFFKLSQLSYKGGALSAAAPNTNVALALSAPLLVPLMIFGGFFLNNE